MRVDIKPLSINEAYRGRRFKTAKYKSYEEELYYLLPKLEVGEGMLGLEIEFGVSSKASDLDNCVKSFLDVLQKKYHFDDKRVYRLILEKMDVKKGKEYIDFQIYNI